MSEPDSSSMLIPGPRLAVQDHAAWAERDRYYRGWIACFSVKAGCIEYVRDGNRSIRLFPSQEEARVAALEAHVDRQNTPRPAVQPKPRHGMQRPPRSRAEKLRLNAAKIFGRGGHGS